MKSTILKTCSLAIFLIIALTTTAQSTEFRFPLGLVYTSGATQIADKMKTNYYVSSDFVWPVGLAVNPYVEFDNGLGIGGGFGPYVFLLIDNGKDTSFSYALPVGLDLRYTFLRKSAAAPYVRAGFRYPIAGGDYLKEGKIGAFGGIGIEFWRTKKAALGVEISYDDSKIKVKAGGYAARPNTKEQEVAASGLMIGVFVVF
jgi:hypothetical protein